jgi:phosphate transport system protein
MRLLVAEIFMSKHLERDLEALEREILAQSSLVEEMIAKACRALVDRRADLLSEVMASERTIDVREVKIEEECLKILALHQPVAVDLRRTATVLKINTELERIADLAVNIAERTGQLCEHLEFEIPDKVERMSTKATDMVHDALDAFVDLDVALAREVCLSDEEVDKLNRQVIDELYETMQSQPESIEAALNVFSVSRHVERIADCATNIAEDVIYLVEGEIARHHAVEMKPHLM